MRTRASATQPPADLRSRNLKTVQRLSLDMLGRPTGSRVPTTVDYQKQFSVGSGTVQKALAILEHSGAVTLSRHGHLGTRLVDQDEGLLWSMSGRGQVRLALHPPGPITGFGLLRGLQSEFDTLGVPLDVRYAHGGEDRAELVVSGEVDAGLVSAGIAESLRRALRRKITTVTVGEGLYYAPGSVFVVRREDAAKRPRRVRVGVDRTSHDHTVVTTAAFPEDAKNVYVDCPYSQVLTALLERRIDVALWHSTLLPVPLTAMGLTATPLEDDAAVQALATVSDAVIVLRRDDLALGRLVERIDTGALSREAEDLLRLDPAAPDLQSRVWER
ncbi:MAG TPA: YhfZ family protein [Streptosporangiales bacterium]